MATDATGTPTSLGIPTYNTAADAPSGNGFNAAMSTIDSLISARMLNSVGTTAGDLIYFSGASTPARLGIGTAGQVLTVTAGLPAWAAAGGGGTTVPSYTARTLVDVVNTVTQTDLISAAITITGGDLSNGKLLHAFLHGDMLFNNNSADVLGLAFKLGATTVWDTGTGGAGWNAGGLLGATRVPWSLYINVQETASNTQFTTSQFFLGRNDTPVTGIGGLRSQANTMSLASNGTTAVTMSSNQTFKVQATWSAASVNNSFRCYGCNIFVI